jgi:hypothetical protein
MRKISLIFILLVVLIGSCVDPLDINIDEEVNVLIVEGSITTLSGPYNIRLSRSAKYGNIFEGFVRPEQRAKVSIRDSDGVSVSLSESSDGTGIYYTPDDFLAVAGKSYSLLITLANGTDYTSLPEKIKRATDILELSAEFTKTPLEGNKIQTGLKIYATFQDNPEEKNFLMWKNNGTYQTVTFPENFLARDPLGGPAIIPAPKECCVICWVHELADRSIRLFKDNNVSGNLITAQAAFIEDDGVRFTDKYLVRIEQHSLTREAFQFFQLLEAQISINGDIFDPPPATIRGNMINLTNPDDNVIGYFRASDVSVDSLFLTQEMLLERQPLVQINDDCRTFRRGTTERPVYW